MTTHEPPRKRPRPATIALRAAAALVLVGLFVAIGFAIGVFIQSQPQWAVLSTAASDEAFERRVADYLANHPEAIADAFERYAARLGESGAMSLPPTTSRGQVSASRLTPRERKRQLLEDPESPVGGNADGKVTLVEFFDYNCPYCRRARTILEKLREANPDLRIVYKEFPILSDNSRFAARAALAARKQDKYFELHDALMRAGGVVTPDRVIEIARALGLRAAQLRRDMDDPQIQAIIDRNLALAASLRITGTPGFVVGDRIFRGAADIQTLQALIDRDR